MSRTEPAGRVEGVDEKRGGAVASALAALVAVDEVELSGELLALAPVPEERR